MPLHPKNGGAQKQVSVSTTEFLIIFFGGGRHTCIVFAPGCQEP